MRNFKKNLRLTGIMCILCFIMTGCGNNDNDTTTENNNTNSEDSVMDNIEDAVEDTADGVGNAVNDITNGVGNAVDDLVGNNGFDNYKDAHSYFLDTMNSYHTDANFELRDENENLIDYQEGSKGYHFKLYDTSKNKEGELFGEFYVDSTSGFIYKKSENNSFEKYPINPENKTSNEDMEP